MIRTREGRAVLRSVSPLARCPGSGCTAQGGSGPLRLGHSFNMASCGHEERTERRGGPGRSRGDVQGRGVAIVVPDLWLSLPPLWWFPGGHAKDFRSMRFLDRPFIFLQRKPFPFSNHRFQASLITGAPECGWMNWALSDQRSRLLCCSSRTSLAGRVRRFSPLKLACRPPLV